MDPGEVVVLLQWRHKFSSEKIWRCSPSIGDGFEMGRILGALNDHVIEAPSAYSSWLFYYPNIQNWSIVGDSLSSFELTNATHVEFTYSLPISQKGNQDSEIGRHTSYEAIQSRILVDGIWYRHQHFMDATRSSSDMQATLIIPLAGGTHTACVLWENRTDNMWRSIVGSSSQSVHLRVTFHHNEPVISSPVSYTVFEDEDMVLSGINVRDKSFLDLIDYIVEVNLAVVHGTLILLQSAGDDNEQTENNRYFMSGKVSYINARLDRIVYRANSDWNGQDQLSLFVRSKEYDGISSKVDTCIIDIHVQPVNDPPQLAVPMQMILLEDDKVDIFGISVSDKDIELDPVTNHNIVSEYIEVWLHVVDGVLVFPHAGNLQVLQGDISADQLLHVRGRLSDVNLALQEVVYYPSSDYNALQHEEFIGIHVRDEEGAESEAQIELVVLPFDDKPYLEKRAAFSVALQGYKLIFDEFLTSMKDQKAFVRMQTVTKSGKLKLAQGSSNFTSDLEWISPNDPHISSSYLEFGGYVQKVAKFLESLVYTRAPSFDGYEVIHISLSHLPTFYDSQHFVIQMALQIETRNPVIPKTPIRIRQLQPNRGNFFGGTHISIVGSGFSILYDLYDTLMCKVGTNDAVVATFLNDTNLICVSPSNRQSNNGISVNTTFLMITDEHEQFYTNPLAYVYDSIWQLEAVYPKVLSVMTSTRLRLHGYNFVNLASWRCIFDKAIAVTAYFMSPNQLECFAPPALTKQRKNITVRLTNNGVESSMAFLLSYKGIVIGIRYQGFRLLITFSRYSANKSGRATHKLFW